MDGNRNNSNVHGNGVAGQHDGLERRPNLIQGSNVFAGFVFGLVVGAFLAVAVGSLNNLIDYQTYQQCRRYNQDVQRCVEEIHYEKRAPAESRVDEPRRPLD